MKIGSLNVSNTSGKGGRPDRVTVYKGGVVIARVELSKRNPLRYLRNWPRSQYSLSLAQQLRDSGIDEAEIAKVLEPAPKRGAKAGPPAGPTDAMSQYWFGLMKS